MNLVPYGAPADPALIEHRYESRKGYVRLDGPADGDGLIEVFPSSTSYIHHVKPGAPEPETTPPAVVGTGAAAAPGRPRDARGRLLSKQE